jgi:hypothetical protein
MAEKMHQLVPLEHPNLSISVLKKCTRPETPAVCSANPAGHFPTDCAMATMTPPAVPLRWNLTRLNFNENIIHHSKTPAGFAPALPQPTRGTKFPAIGTVGIQSRIN